LRKQISSLNLRDQVYDILKNMIVLREIGPGEKINEELFAKQTGVSRTPIREALCRLENENIVEMIPRRGAFVRKQSAETVREVLEVREALEAMVTRLATRNSHKTLLQKLGKCLDDIIQVPDEKRFLTQYTKSDVKFHLLLLEAACNRMLQQMMETVNTHLQIIRLRTVVLPGRAKKTVAEHYLILEAMQKQDEKAAETLMKRHIESVRIDALNHIDAME
jgi:DNA-binding GntR family transcriptional regulator